MAFGHLADQSFHSELKVRPEQTDQVGELVHPKAKTLDMSTKHRFNTDYNVSAVVLSFRGDKDEIRNQIGELYSRDYTPRESTTKSNQTDSPMHVGNIGGAQAVNDMEKSWDL